MWPGIGSGPHSRLASGPLGRTILGMVQRPPAGTIPDEPGSFGWLNLGSNSVDWSR